MKTKHKALLLTLCAVLLVAASVLGTIAYFTDSEAVKNTFTVGSVDLKLDEAVVDKETGKAVASKERTEVGNKDILLIPGRVVDKDPTVTVIGGSEETYVRMMVTVTYNEAADAVFAKTGYQSWFNFNTTDWDAGKLVSTTKADGKIACTYEFRYKNVVPAPGTDIKLSPLFTEVKVPESLTNEQLAAMKELSIDVVAHAIQAAGFDTADEAWAAFGTQNA